MTSRRLVWALPLIALSCLIHQPDFPALRREIRRRFPDVAQIQTAELAAWLDATNRPPPVLLDVRTKEEFTVSHLPQARSVDPAGELPGDISRNAPVVTYCSVGYRSSQFARRLQQAGFTNVRQLDGSIFQWANEGRPLAGGTQVHPYDAAWGQFLKPELRATVPAITTTRSALSGPR
jgi:rhodanese-related sulfurtransferase